LNAALVLLGGPKWPDGAKLKAHGIRRLYYEARDTQVDTAFFKQLRTWGYEAGIDYDPSWDGWPAPVKAVDKVIGHLIKFGALKRNADGSLSNLAPMPVMLDMEHHDPVYAEAFLREFRDRQPGRNIVWTLESMQAGWFEPSLVALINDYAQLRVAPQFYEGDMTPMAADQSFKDLIVYGVSPTRLVGFYGLRDQYEQPIAIPTWWDGILYVERLSQL
jgi:hypothetical protein